MPWVAPKEPAPFRASSFHSHVWLIQSWQLEVSWNAWHEREQPGFAPAGFQSKLKAVSKWGFTWFYIALTVLVLKIFWNTRRDVYVRFGNEHSLGLWFLFCSKQEEEKPVEIKGFLQEALLKVAQCISGQIWTKWRELVTVSVWNSWGLVLREWDKWIYNNAIWFTWNITILVKNPFGPKML